MSKYGVCDAFIIIMVKLAIGIVGAIGAGKDTAASYLVERYGFAKYNTSDVIREKLRKIGKIDFTRKDMQEMSKWMRIEGRDVLTERTLAKIYESGEELVLILGVRLADGVEYLRKELGTRFVLLAIEGKQRIRFKRKQKSERSDDRDLQSWEEFKRNDDLELGGFEGSAQEVGKVVALAEVMVKNNGSLKELHGKLNEAIEEIGYGLKVGVALE